jgi:DNA-binding NarL/FixJ family response regulator
MDGLQATSRHVHEPGLRTRIVILTTFEREDHILDALRAGASDFSLRSRRPRSSCKTHVSNVLTKLGLRDRMQAFIFAYESGLIEPGQPRDQMPTPSRANIDTLRGAS